jgi:protein CpxP
MNVSSLRFALLAGLALPLGLATASLAQDAPTTPAAGAQPAMRPDHHWDPAARRAHMAERLSAVLQLQPAQQSALAAYLDAIKPPGDMQARGDMKPRMGEDTARLPTPERLDQMMARFDQMHAHLVVRVAATKQFYAQLSPSQQKAFDELAPMMMHRFGGGRGGMDGRRGGGWGHQMGPDGQSPG